jgi:hypothetical protein
MAENLASVSVSPIYLRATSYREGLVRVAFAHEDVPVRVRDFILHLAIRLRT